MTFLKISEYERSSQVSFRTLFRIPSIFYWKSMKDLEKENLKHGVGFDVGEGEVIDSLEGAKRTVEARIFSHFEISLTNIFFCFNVFTFDIFHQTQFFEPNSRYRRLKLYVDTIAREN